MCSCGCTPSPPSAPLANLLPALACSNRPGLSLPACRARAQCRTRRSCSRCWQRAARRQTSFAAASCRRRSTSEGRTVRSASAANPAEEACLGASLDVNGCGACGAAWAADGAVGDGGTSRGRAASSKHAAAGRSPRHLAQLPSSLPRPHRHAIMQRWRLGRSRLAGWSKRLCPACSCRGSGKKRRRRRTRARGRRDRPRTLLCFPVPLMPAACTLPPPARSSCFATALLSRCSVLLVLSSRWTQHHVASVVHMLAASVGAASGVLVGGWMGAERGKRRGAGARHYSFEKPVAAGSWPYGPPRALPPPPPCMLGSPSLAAIPSCGTDPMPHALDRGSLCCACKGEKVQGSCLFPVANRLPTTVQTPLVGCLQQALTAWPCFPRIRLLPAHRNEPPWAQEGVLAGGHPTVRWFDLRSARRRCPAGQDGAAAAGALHRIGQLNDVARPR